MNSKAPGHTRALCAHRDSGEVPPAEPDPWNTPLAHSPIGGADRRHKRNADSVLIDVRTFNPTDTLCDSLEVHLFGEAQATERSAPLATI